MSNKRDRLQIIFDILVSIQRKRGRIKPTHLLYKSNLSYKRMNIYLDELIKQEFIKQEFDEENKFYCITNKGNLFVQEYMRIKEFTNSFGI
jgi:predicted transcriptional regulator